MIYLFAFYDDQHHLTVMVLVIAVIAMEMVLLPGVMNWDENIVLLKLNTFPIHNRITWILSLMLSFQSIVSHKPSSFQRNVSFLFFLCIFLFSCHKPTDTIHEYSTFRVSLICTNIFWAQPFRMCYENHMGIINNPFKLNFNEHAKTRNVKQQHQHTVYIH